MQVVERVLTIITLLSQYPEGLGVTILSEDINIPKSTTHRLLQILIRHEFVERKGQLYVLGPSLLRIAHSVFDRFDLREAARPYLEELAETTKETAYISLFSGNQVVCLDAVCSNQNLRYFAKPGVILPLHCTSPGKLYLAQLYEEDKKRALKSLSFERFTDNTITDAALMRKELDKINLLGYAICEQEHEEGVRGISVAIANRKNKAIGCVTVVGPYIRLSDTPINTILNPLRLTANAIKNAMTDNL